MEKKTNKILWITTLLCLLPIILALIMYDRLPAQIAIHFDSNGDPDNYLPKALAAFGFPVFLALVNLYAHFRVNRDPKVENASVALKQVYKWALPVASVIFMPITLFMAAGAQVPIGMIAKALTGILIAIAGNYLPKSRRNYTIGIKLPWTLDNQDNWNRTHRFAGFLWIAGGIVFTLNAFLGYLYVSIGIIILLVAAPPVCSYLTYRKQQK